MGGCSSVKVNWRWTTHAHGVTHQPGYHRNFWASMHFDIGEPNEHVKTFARVETHGNFLDPHQALPSSTFSGKFVPYRDDFTLGVAGSPWEKPTAHAGQRAVVLHARCSTLIDWVSRKSLRGRADVPGAMIVSGGGYCPSCGAQSIRAIVNDFHSQCAVARGWWQTGRTTLPQTSVERAILQFVTRHDFRVGQMVRNASASIATMVNSGPGSGEPYF